MIRVATLASLHYSSASSQPRSRRNRPSLADQLAKAGRSDSITIPTRASFSPRSERQGDKLVRSLSRANTVTYSNRAQIALNLGGLIAEVLLLSKQRTSAGKKYRIRHSSSLQRRSESASSCFSRAVSIQTELPSTTSGHYRNELEATQNEVKILNAIHADQDLVILMTLALDSCIPGVTAAIVKDYSKAGKSLRQPALVHFIAVKNQ